MKKTGKILLLVLCAVLLVVGSVAGTLAYLTSNDTATNTFTVGKVEISLQEYEVDKQTGKKNATVVDGLEDLELVPGRTIEKNPFITVASGSESCWLFVKIENNLGDAVTINGLTSNGWTPVVGKDGYYQYTYAVSENTVVQVFDSITCVATKDYEALNGIASKNIVITAYAVQSEGVSAQDAWGALGQHYTLG